MSRFVPPPVVDLLVLGLCGVLLAAAGVAPGMDSIVWYVFSIVDGVPDTVRGVLAPIYNPPPMYTHAYRPLSTVLLKAGTGLFGRGPDGLAAMGFAHGLILVAYGLAGRAALAALGHGRATALLGSLLAVASPTVLFSAWTLPEFDALGAACVLAGAAALLRDRVTLAVPFLVLALLTKETSAVFALAFLLAWVSVVAPKGNRRSLVVLASFCVGLAAAVAPIVLTPPPVTHSFSLVDPGFRAARLLWLFHHDGTQLFASVGMAGAVLVLWRWWCRRRAASGRGLAVGSAVAVLGAPVLHRYNHYESIVLSDWPFVAAGVCVLLLGLGGLATTGTDAERIQGRFVWLGLMGLLAGPVLTGFSRADLSARLFAPVLPIVLGLGLQGAQLAARRRGPLRIVGTGLAVCLVWMPAAGAFNAWQAHQARFGLEGVAKEDLARSLEAPCPLVIETNRDQEIAVEELARLGADPAVLGCLRILQLSHVDTGAGGLFAGPTPLEGFDQSRVPASNDGLARALEDGAPLPHPVQLYVQGPRARFVLPDPADPHRSLAWAEDRMPDVRPGNLEQAVGMSFVPDTPLERHFSATSTLSLSVEAPYVQVPVFLGTVPRRLWEGWPLVESWVWQARRWTR